jgi:FKBP-type peptidyl-prolyl cis-trans isomerase
LIQDDNLFDRFIALTPQPFLSSRNATMPRSWKNQIAAWIRRNEARAAARRSRRRRQHGRLCAAAIAGPEILESRELLSAVIGVHVTGNSIRLTEQGHGNNATGADFSISYTSSQVVLTGNNGTSFRVNGQTQTTDTISITSPAALTISLNRESNVINLSGDGTSSLSKLRVQGGRGSQSNSITLTSLIADSVNIQGSRSNDAVTLSQSTVNGNLTALLGRSSGDTLDLESTTVNGNLRDQVGQLTTNQSTIDGKVNNVEGGKNSTLDSTDTTYNGDVAFKMGPSGVINLMSSAAGSNEFQSSVSIKGSRGHETTVNQDPESVFFAVTPKTRNVSFTTTSGPTGNLGTPTVNSQTVTTNAAPVISGTFDSVNTTVLTVNANGSTFTLGSSSQLTSPSAGNWSLDLGSVSLSSPVTTVTVSATDKSSNTKTGTGTITDGAGIIANYLAANKLTATTTSDGLNYVIETKGTGPIPKKGQTVTVNYSGFLLNSDATIGTEFDSNTDSKFGHVTPFSFVLGQGQVIAGWDEAFSLLPVGTVAQLVIPSALAYGVNGNPPSIPSNSILIFNVTLISAT